MKLERGEFETEVLGGMYQIRITKKNDLLSDGSYTFKDVISVYELTKSDAKKLIKELCEFCNEDIGV